MNMWNVNDGFNKSLIVRKANWLVKQYKMKRSDAFIISWRYAKNQKDNFFKKESILYNTINSFEFGKSRKELVSFLNNLFYHNYQTKDKDFYQEILFDGKIIAFIIPVKGKFVIQDINNNKYTLNGFINTIRRRSVRKELLVV